MKNFENSPSNASAERPDAALVLAARRGDKRAFVEIVARHQAMVCGIAFAILNDFAASEDAAQEAFLTAWRKIGELRDPDRLRPWLAQISRNAALAHLRKRRGEEPLDKTAEFIDAARRPDEAAATEEEAELVRGALEKLPELYRLPLILFYREGQSVRVVAETLGISEDAVKQRLARGRELLRDRIENVVERVLKRTAPSAMFTMAIAAAIGALAAPGTVAAAAFTGASVAAASSPATAAASTSASSTTSIITLMSTTKGVAIAAAIVALACIPVGYHISVALSRRGNAEGTANHLTTAAPKSAAVPSFEGSAIFAEWRALHDKYGTNAAAMPLLYKAIRDMKDPARRAMFGAALVSEWVGIDPAAGLAFFLEKDRDADQRKQFFKEWLAQDAQTAVTALLKNPGWEKLGRESLLDIAREAPNRVPEVAARLPKAEDVFDTKVADAFGLLAEGNVESVRQIAENLPGPNREQALAGVARAWAKTDIDGAIAWAKALPSGIDHDEIIRNALTGLAATNPAGALDRASMVPAGGNPGYFATTTGARILSAAAEADFDATVAWLAEHPGRMSQEDMMGIRGPVSEKLNSDPTGFLTQQSNNGTLSAVLEPIGQELLGNAAGLRETIWDWLKTQPDSEDVKTLRRSVMLSAAWQDVGLALKFAQDLPDTPEGNENLNRLATDIFSGGSFPGNFEEIYAKAPDRMRPLLAESAFQGLNDFTLVDPQVWLNRLSYLPKDQQASAARKVVAAWAGQSPEEAAAWVRALSEGDQREAALASLTDAWLGKDEQNLVAWIDSLPPGLDRDITAEQMAYKLADSRPNDAWQWALSIQDPLHKTRAAYFSLQRIGARNPVLAKQWLDQISISTQDKARLQSILERLSSK
jgi:RNA polymerase sigma factor (sigma-70 family)